MTKPKEKKSRVVRHHKSTHPKVGVMLAGLKHGSERWMLALTPQVSRTFVNLKLYSLDYVPHKAAYWLSWALPRARFINGRTHSLEPLQAYRPWLYAAVEHLVAGWIALIGPEGLYAVTEDDPDWGLPFVCTASGPVISTDSWDQDGPDPYAGAPIPAIPAIPNRDTQGLAKAPKTTQADPAPGSIPAIPAIPTHPRGMRDAGIAGAGAATKNINIGEPTDLDEETI